MFNFPDSLSRKNIACVDHFIAVSQSTRNNLIDNYKIDPEKISLAYEFIPLDKIKGSTISKEEARRELGLTDEFIIGGAGAPIWRKGIDLFIQLAVVLNKIRPDNNIKLIWVGFQDYEAECQFKYESKRYGLQDKVRFIGKKEIPQNYFQLFDVFALTSREDPFPLVAIEAASLQKPIICFKEAGGIPELLSDNKGGICVNYGDFEEMAKAILYLKEQDSIRIKMGEEAAKLTADYDVNVISKEIKQTISTFI